MPGQISFHRLPEIPAKDLLAHMRDPKVGEHLPLMDFEWTDDKLAEFVAAKEACWARDGLGHWAIRCDGAYVGWGGFQKEGEEWDFGLVLKPGCFGLGQAITRKALEFARQDARITYVTFLLPPSRRNLGALSRMGAAFLGKVDHDGQTFRKYRLDTV